VDAKPQPRQRSAVSWWGLLEIGSLLLCLTTLTGFLARLGWIFEINFPFPSTAGRGAGGAGRHLGAEATLAVDGGLQRRRGSQCVSAPVTPLAQPGARLRLTAINVHAANERTDLVLRFLRYALRIRTSSPNRMKMISASLCSVGYR